MFRNNFLHDFGGSAADGQHPVVAKQALHSIAAHKPIASEYLHRIIGHPVAYHAGKVFVKTLVFLPDEIMGNVSKLNICNAFWRVMALAGDIGGGLVVTMPSMKELKNPEVKDYVEEFYSFGSDEPTENIMKVHKLLQNWTAGMHGVGTWHGAGPVMAQKIMLQRVIDYEPDKALVRHVLKLKQ